jgi:hypothetical protein
MAGKTVAAKDRQDFLFEIDVAWMLHISDGDGLGLGAPRGQHERGECNDCNSGERHL